MPAPLVKPTLEIFERLCDDLPPLFPKEIGADLERAREQMLLNHGLTIEELEDTMIAFGKKIWPYRRAFEEFVEIYEGKLGEKFLMGKLSPTMKQRYKQFKEYGGTFRDLHSGAPASFFSADERGNLCASLVDVRRDIRDHARQAALSVDRRKYEDRILEFQTILDDIEKRLDTLRLMAEDEQEHPELAAEIRAQVQGFEHGLCFLGPRVDYEAVCNAAPHFEGRKLEKKMRAHH